MNHTTTIGEKVKSLRASQSLTLKQLSELTGLSTGFLSQMERGLSPIAIDSLENISKALGVELSTFFDNKKLKNGDYVIHSFTQQYKSSSPQIFQAILSHDVSSYDMLPRLSILMPQESADKEELEMYNHNGEEFIYVLEGTITLFLDSHIYTLYPGDCIQFKSTIDHNWINLTNKIAKLLTINLPNPFHEV